MQVVDIDTLQDISVALQKAFREKKNRLLQASIPAMHYTTKSHITTHSPRLAWFTTISVVHGVVEGMLSGSDHTREDGSV